MSVNAAVGARRSGKENVRHFPLDVPDDRTAQPIEVRAPFDGRLLATVDVCGEGGVDHALTTAYTLFRDRGAWLTRPHRIAILQTAAAIVAERAEDLALEAAAEGGKPLVDSRVEIARAIDGLLNCVEEMRKPTGNVIPMDLNAASSGRVAFTRREPIGVVVAVSAFNHPFNLIVHQVGPAVAAGCPVIVKPASDTPISCFRLVEILREAGLPPAWCQVLLTSTNDVTTKLVSDERVAFLSFIGSARVGWMLRSKLAPGARCALEHGGVAPAIVAADADLELAAAKLVIGGFYHAGQVCVSVQRIYAHRSISRDLAERIAAAARALRVGDPTSAETDVGPLIRTQEVQRVEAWVTEAIGAGATALCGAAVLSASCYAPTVLLEPPENCRISREEVFGPVVCVYAFDDLDEAITRANALPVAFQSAVFTRDYASAMHAYSRLDASAVMVNDHTAFRVDWMPFAGLRQSGLGVGGIPYTFHEMQVEKMFVGPA